MTADWLNAPAKTPSASAREAATAHQGVLTKPPGALGRLEEVAITLAGLLDNPRPRVDKLRIVVFAGDHGIAEEGVSAFPQAVTTEMVRNFARGGAAISVLARSLGADLEVVNLGTVTDPGPLPGVLDERIAPSTANFARAPAMTEEHLAHALGAGRLAVERAAKGGAQLFIGGEMGIANTTTATALACALLKAEPSAIAGPGTGLDAAGVTHKAQVIARALALHGGALATPIEALRRVGGFEIAALTGAFMACAQSGLPVLVDGFIASVGALTASRLIEGAGEWFLFAHRSAEPGHARVLEALGARPLLDLGMRLGEGSGAATAVPLLRLACALHDEMATFAEAGVSEKLPE